MRKIAEENRRHVLATAGGLFYEHGIRAIGMDRIVREAKVGNATVYRQFPTKDDLATAYVQERADAWITSMQAAVAGIEDPAEKIRTVFRATAQDCARPTFRGCPMLNTNTEFPDRSHPANHVAVAHKGQVRDWFRDLATGAGARDPERLADQLLLVLNGAFATAAVLGPDSAARECEALAAQLVAAATD
ncbi:MAG: TetR/AcrR family transcriptional regulator [Blastococcus sp.]